MSVRKTIGVIGKAILTVVVGILGLVVLLFLLPFLVPLVDFGMQTWKNVFDGQNVIVKTVPKDAPELYSLLNGHDEPGSVTNDFMCGTYYMLLQCPQGKEIPIHFDLGVLDELAEKRRDILLRYLATHPSWKLWNKGRTGLTARRRLPCNGVWADDAMNGMSLRRHVGKRSARCFVEVEIGFEGAVEFMEYTGSRDYRTSVRMGEKRVVGVGNYMDGYLSQVEVRGRRVTLGLTERQRFSDCRYIAASVACLKKEFEALRDAKDWDDVMKLMPEGTVGDGGNRLDVYHDGIGTYRSVIRVNPGEEGFVYVRVADPETGRHLWKTETHPPRLKLRSNEYVGWSSDANETFYVSTGFSMYDGEYGKPNPVNVEVWFSPKAGGRDRKLTEQAFNLEAWVR